MGSFYNFITFTRQLPDYLNQKSEIFFILDSTELQQQKTEINFILAIAPEADFRGLMSL